MDHRYPLKACKSRKFSVDAVTVSVVDFFVEKHDAPWDKPSTALNVHWLNALMAKPDSTHSDLNVAVALMELVWDELELSGTSGEHRLADEEMRAAIRALTRTLDRIGHAFTLPFRDHTAWRSYWKRNGASGAGGWQARRELLRELFEEQHTRLLAAQDRELDSTLADPVSPHTRLGWTYIDTEVAELRRHFRSAVTPQDYRAVGNDCVHITEALSRQVYDHAKHTPEGQDEPPVGKTKLRLVRFIETRLPGSEKQELRTFARSVIELAQAVKHSETPSRTEAGLVADSVILLANMLRRLEEV